MSKEFELKGLLICGRRKYRGNMLEIKSNILERLGFEIGRCSDYINRNQKILVNSRLSNYLKRDC